MKLRHLFAGALSALAAISIGSAASASSHREAPAIGFDPAADNTDTWAWVNDGAHDKLYVVASYNPLEEPSGGPNYNEFSDDVLYEIHITRGNKSLEDVITYQIQFSSTDYPRVAVDDKNAPLGGGKEFFAQLGGRTQTYWVTKLDWEAGNKKARRTVLAQGLSVAPANIGPNTNSIVYKTGAYDDAFMDKFIHPLGGGVEGRVFAGQTDDAFYVDIGRIFDLANLLKGNARDNVAAYNCHTIALEIPTIKVSKDGAPPAAGASNDNTLGVWASASRRQVRILHRGKGESNLGGWVQVSRLGLPLINEAVIGIQDKDKYNRTRPANDVKNFGAYFLNPIIVRDAEAVGIYTALGVPQATVDALKYGRTDILDVINLAPAHQIPIEATGDVLRVDLGLDSRFPNGRPIPYGAAANKEQADVTDVLLSILLTKQPTGVSDGVNSNDKPFRTTFPYVAAPHEGFSGGHGAPAP